MIVINLICHLQGWPFMAEPLVQPEEPDPERCKIWNNGKNPFFRTGRNDVDPLCPILKGLASAAFCGLMSASRKMQRTTHSTTALSFVMTVACYE